VGLIGVYGDHARRCLVVEVVRVASGPSIEIGSHKYNLQIGEAEDLINTLLKALEVAKNGQ
jgi:hypothetical protein